MGLKFVEVDLNEEGIITVIYQDENGNKLKFQFKELSRFLQVFLKENTTFNTFS